MSIQTTTQAAAGMAPPSAAAATALHEFRSSFEPTRIANAPDFIKGVAKLRRVIVPVVDMRLKCKLESANCDSFKAVIVLNLGARVMGRVVGAMSDVITLSPEELRPVPDFNSAIVSDHLPAIGAAQDRLLILIDIEERLTCPELRPVEQTLQ